MTNVVKWHPNRTIFDANALVNGGGETTLVCINRDVIPIIIEYLSTRGLALNSYFVGTPAQTYTTPDVATFDVVDRLISGAIYDLQQGYDMGTCDLLNDNLVAINVTLKEVRDALAAQTQAQVSVACGCGPSGTNPNASDNSTACLTPADFGSWAEFIAYSCNAANWIFDTLENSMRFVQNNYHSFIGDYTLSGAGATTLGVTQVYQRFAQIFPGVLPLEWSYNLADTKRAALYSNLTDHYIRFRTDKFLRVPETDPLADVVNDWYDGARHMADYFGANQATIVQAFFDAQTAGALLTEVADQVTNAYDYADLQGSGDPGLDFVKGIIDQVYDIGVALIAFTKSIAVQSYQGAIACTGDKGCCPVVALLQGVSQGSNQYTSVPSGGKHVVDLINYATAIGQHCDGEGQWDIPTMIAGDDPDSYEIFDDSNVSQGVTAWPMASATSGRRILWVGSSEFTIEQTAGPGT